MGQVLVNPKQNLFAERKNTLGAVKHASMTNLDNEEMNENLLNHPALKKPSFAMQAARNSIHITNSLPPIEPGILPRIPGREEAPLTKFLDMSTAKQRI